MLYNLIIVDDEPEIAKFLSDICKEIIEFEVEVYTAYSAYESLLLKKVDMLFTCLLSVYNIKIPEFFY